MKSQDDEDSRLDRILQTRHSYRWPYCVNVDAETFTESETEIKDWVRSVERKGNVEIYGSYTRTVKVYFDNQDDQMEFFLRWR
jgi:hypothetical protein